MGTHQTAIVAKDAEIDASAEIGPHVVIEERVKIGSGVKIMANAYICRGTEIGDGTTVHVGAVIGNVPQDYSYKGEETFTKIGKDVFPQATETILDMSTAFKQDLKSSAIQLGKALDNPIKGVSALARVGVSFSDQEKEKIKTLQESGKMMEAQNMILGSLKRQTEGAARAAAKTLGGGFQQASNALGDLIENIGKDMTPALTGLSASFSASASSGGGLATILEGLGTILSKMVGLVAIAVDGYSLMANLGSKMFNEDLANKAGAQAESLMEDLLELKDAGKENTEEFKELKKEFDRVFLIQQRASASFSESTEALSSQAEAAKNNWETFKGNVDISHDMEKTQTDMKDAIKLSNEAMEEATKTTGEYSEASKTLIQNLEEVTLSEQAQREEMITKAQEFFSKRAELEGLDHESRLEFLQAQHEAVQEMETLNAEQRIEAEEAINRAIEKEREDHFKKMIEFSQMSISATGDLVNSLQQIMKNFGKESYALAIAAKGIAMAEAAINSYLAFTNALASVPYPFNFVAAGITLAAGLAKQVAIATTPIPKAETGISNYTVPESRSTRLDGAAVMAQGGETINVTPKGEDSGGTQNINIQVGEDIIYRVVNKGIRNGNIDVNNNNIGKGIFV